jgi:hypothetical protein
VRARKRFGQHFLEPAWVAKLVAAIDPRPDRTFLEIGPGAGALTAGARAARRPLVAVEIDRDLAAALPSACPRPSASSRATSWTPTSRALLAGERCPCAWPATSLQRGHADPGEAARAAAAGAMLADATVMLQKEVAERVVARPGLADYGPLAVAVALDADAETVLTLRPARSARRPRSPRASSACASARRPWTSGPGGVHAPGPGRVPAAAEDDPQRLGARRRTLGATPRISLHGLELTRRSAPAICRSRGSRRFARCAIVFHPKSLSPPAFWAFPDARRAPPIGARPRPRDCSPEHALA